MSVFDLPSASLPLEAWATSQKEAAPSSLSPIRLRDLTILSKSGQTVSFDPLPVQRRILELVKKVRHEIEIGTRPRGRTRIVVLKARQMGASTVIQAMGLKLVGTHENAQGLVVAHVSESAQYLHSMSRGMHERLPVDCRPALSADSRRAIVFAPPLRSELVVQVVDEGLGRSRTLHFLHASEVALWGSAGADALAAVRGALVDEPWCLEILESTGYGMGGVFYDEYYAAKADGRALFSPWYEDPRYRTTPGLTLAQVRELGGPSEAIEYIGTTHARCAAIRDRAGDAGAAGEVRAGLRELRVQGSASAALDASQLAWLRYKLIDVYRGDVAAFRREFPSTEEEAFQGDARGVFSDEILRRVGEAIEEAREWPRARGGPIDEAPGLNLVQRLDDFGPPDSAFVIGGDPAEGLEHGDDSALVVVDRVRRRVCAMGVTKLDPDEFAALLLALARYYNGAHICVESNNRGYAVLMRLRDAGYPRIWRERQAVRVKNDVISSFGYRTTAPSKSAAVAAVVAAVRENRLAIPFVEIREQMRSFIRDENGKMGAAPGCKDDLVSALWLSVVAADDLGVSDPVQADFIEVRKKLDLATRNGLVVQKAFEELVREQHPSFDGYDFESEGGGEREPQIGRELFK